MTKTFCAILGAAAVGLLLGFGFSGRQGGLTAAAKAETVFDRVMRTGTIRCGYTTWAPYFTIDPATGAKSGIAFDVMKAIGDEMGLRVEWVEETGWGNFHEGLNANRYDAMCVPLWESGQRARHTLLTRPVYDNALYAYAREGDRRFDETFDEANRPDVTFVVIEGDVMQADRRQRFPRAKELALPQMADEAQALLSVAGRKADIALDNPFGIAQYNKGASIKMHPIAGGKPVRLFANCLALKLGETEWKAALDSTIGALVKNGTLNRILTNYPGFAPTDGN